MCTFPGDSNFPIGSFLDLKSGIFAKEPLRADVCTEPRPEGRRGPPGPVREEQSGPNSAQVVRSSITPGVLLLCSLVFGTGMSARLHRSPSKRSPLQPDHKARDVTGGPDIKRQAAGGAEPPDVGVRAPLEETSTMEKLLHKCQIRNRLLRECLAEFLGVYVLIVSNKREGC